jgi:hypothetical protein
VSIQSRNPYSWLSSAQLKRIKQDLSEEPLHFAQLDSDASDRQIRACSIKREEWSQASADSGAVAALCRVASGIEPHDLISSKGDCRAGERRRRD